jgi:hypothetical protein
VGTFRADDGTELAYRVRREGVPLVCWNCGALANRPSLRIRRANAVTARSGGHSLCLDDPEWFVSAVSAFLDDDPAAAVLTALMNAVVIASAFPSGAWRGQQPARTRQPGFKQVKPRRPRNHRKDDIGRSGPGSRVPRRVAMCEPFRFGIREPAGICRTW